LSTLRRFELIRSQKFSLLAQPSYDAQYMTALHVVVHPRPESAPSSALTPLHGVLDVVLDGVNITARVGEGQALDFLVDLVFAVASAATGPRHRASIPLQARSELWELGLQCDAEHLLLSVYCPGPVPNVAVHERKVTIRAFREALLSALDQQAADAAVLPQPLRAGLKSARAALLALPAKPRGPRLQREPILVESSAGGAALSAQLLVCRRAPAVPTHPQLERADLLSLLSSGSLTIRDRQRVLVQGPSQVFLDAERLLALAECALDSWRSAQPTFRRTQLTSTRVSLRRGGGDALLELSFNPLGADASKTRMHRLSCAEFIDLAAGFADSLAAKIRESDPDQRQNLRLRNLQQQAERLQGQIYGETEAESVTNPAPEPYQRFLPRLRRAVGVWETGPKMRFLPRWVAAVPQIDLRGTFLCGDQLVVGSAHETTSLRRSTGEIIWRRATRAAACVVTPSGLVRIEPDGQLNCHQLSDGEIRFSLSVTPRSARSAAGSVLHGPGMPNVLALVEGDRHVTAIDLTGGSVRWRYCARRPGNYRLRRAGRLLLVAGGDPLLVALDGVNGEVIWSLRGRLPFSGDIAVDHDSAFALSGSNGGRFRLHRFNPFSGRPDWDIELDDRPLLGRAPLLTPDVVIVPTVEQEGAGVLAFDRATGRKLWEYSPGLANATCAWLCVDDCVIANGQNGVLLGLSAQSGQVRFNHVFSCNTDADQPRRLEPILRSGALFVPQQQVHVVRPRDGELLGTLPSDQIPDLIRGDERCDVYVAEESGHLAAFGAAPRLALVR
jgi:hypothetical protein